MYHRSLKALIIGFIILLFAVQGIVAVNASSGLKMPPLPPSLPAITPTPTTLPGVTPVPIVTPAPELSPTEQQSSAQGTSTVDMGMFYQQPASAPAAVEDPALATTGREADSAGLLQSDVNEGLMSFGSLSPGDSNLSCANDTVQMTHYHPIFIEATGNWVDQLVSFITGGR